MRLGGAEEPFDIAVVGGGPAGSIAAYAAAQRGYRVALIDRQSFPRDKACGDGIGPAVVTVASELGLDALFAGDVPISAVTVNGPDGSQINASLTELGAAIHGYIVPRRDFDKRLHDYAVKTGLTDFSGWKFSGTSLSPSHRTITLKAQDGTARHIAARLLVGADGANSVVRRALHAAPSLPRHTGIAMRAYAESDAFNPGGAVGPHMFFAFTRDLLPSYAWLFPTGHGTVNIGVGGPLTQIRKADQNLRTLISAYADRIRGQGIPLSNPADHRAHHLPHFGGMPKLVHPHAALIGDAASMINPFSGEGIAYGVTAAALLIRSLPDDIGDSRALGQGLEQFEAQFRDTYRAHMRSTILLYKFMHSPSWAKLFISAAQRDAVVLQDAVDLLFGAGRVRAATAARILRTRWYRATIPSRR